MFDSRRVEMVPNTEVTQYGTICLTLKQHVIELTIDGAIHIINLENRIVLALSKCGSASAMVHPNGKIFGYRSRVEIQAFHPRGNRYAKMWYKGVSFTTDERPVTFLVDAGGIRTTVDWFLDMDHEFTSKAFYFDSHYGLSFISEATSLLYGAQYWITDFGQKNWKIGTIRISETMDGYVRVYKNSNSLKLSSNTRYGSSLLSTPFLHCTASMGTNGHLFVRRGNCRMHFDGKLFVVRNEGQSAGIENDNKLKIY